MLPCRLFLVPNRTNLTFKMLIILVLWQRYGGWWRASIYASSASDGLIKWSQIPYYHRYKTICVLAALLNSFHVPTKTPLPFDDDIIHRMNSLRNKSNDLLIHLNDYHLTGNSIWSVTDIEQLPENFPKLSLSDIRTLTLGISWKTITYLYYFHFRSLPIKKSS